MVKKIKKLEVEKQKKYRGFQNGIYNAILT
jgi:hypothetical protein